MSTPHLPPLKGYIEQKTDDGYEYIPDENEKRFNELVRQNDLLKAQLQVQTARSEFLEDCIAELAIQAYK